MRHLYLLTLLSCLAFSLHAQKARTETQAKFRLPIAKTDAPVKIDGDLSEPVWQTTAVAKDFIMKWPFDKEPAQAKTEVRVAYNEEFLYVAATCYDSGKHILQSLKRDVNYFDSDGIALVLDPVNRSNNGYFFGTTPAGVQYEGLVAALSFSGEPDMNWDNVWWVEVKNHSDKWTAEFAIPLRILRFNAGQSEWGINFIRSDASRGHYSTWTNIPLQFNGFDLGWTGALQWDVPPKPAKGNYAIIPYATAGANRDFEEGEPWKTQADVGLDAKVGLGPKLNLDITVNPDFSQIEVDEQVVNLTRFSIMLPEKRTFFLENADLFSNFGIPFIRPFFSRRIGLDDDGNQVPILGGLRLTGNLDNKTRIGIMNMQTKASPEQAAENFGAFAFDRQLFGRTSIRGYLLNHERFDDEASPLDRFGRNAGGEFSYVSMDGSKVGWVAYNHSFKEGIRNKNWFGNTGFFYQGRQFRLIMDNLHMGENYYTDMGFEGRIENYDFARDTTIRIGYNYQFTETAYTFLPKRESSKLNRTEIQGSSFAVFNPNGSLNEHNLSANLEFNLKNTSSWSFGVERTYSNTPVSFKFDDEDNDVCPPLPAAKYRYAGASLEWNADTRKILTWEAELSAGSFYNGSRFSARAEMGLRMQPWGNLRIAAEYNILEFPKPYCDTEIFAITPRIEFFFSRNLLWTTFLQYNNQSDNFNINSRLQWRFRPMSDVFLVFTDNYAVNVWGPKNRALVLKVNYWI